MRLAGLAADLGRVASLARHATGGAAATAMLEESQYLIEWTAAEAPAELAEEFVDQQVLLTLWRRAWPEAQHTARSSAASRQCKRGSGSTRLCITCPTMCADH